MTIRATPASHSARFSGPTRSALLCRSASRRSRTAAWTSAALAWPRVAFMTWPTRNPTPAPCRRGSRRRPPGWRPGPRRRPPPTDPLSVIWRKPAGGDDRRGAARPIVDVRLEDLAALRPRDRPRPDGLDDRRRARPGDDRHAARCAALRRRRYSPVTQFATGFGSSAGIGRQRRLEQRRRVRVGDEDRRVVRRSARASSR